MVQLAEIVRLYLLNVTPHEIARRLGCSSQEIMGIIERHRLRAMFEELREAQKRSAPGDPSVCAPAAPFRGTVTADLLADLGRFSAAELSRRYDVSECTVLRRRKEAGTPCPSRKGIGRVDWTPEWEEMLGRYTDRYVARRMRLHVGTVARKRRSLGRPAMRARFEVEWSEEAIAWLGRRSDAELARSWDLHPNTVRKKRRELGIAPYRERGFTWSVDLVVDLFLLSFRQFREKHGVPLNEMRAKRRQLRVPPKPSGNALNVRFTPGMLNLLGKRSDAKLARNFHLDINHIRKKRRELSIESHRASGSPWTPEFLARIGKVPDTVLAKEMGVNVTTVAKRRWKLGIKACTQYFKWTKQRIALLGTMPDDELAKRLGLSHRQVLKKRQEQKIPSFDRPKSKWTPERLALLGTMPDEEAARRLKITRVAAQSARIRLGAPAFNQKKGKPTGKAR